MVASEAHPFAKTGGLAEVAASLTDALGQLGHSVTLVLPRYRQVAIDGPAGKDVRLQTRLALGDRLQPVTFYERRLSERVTLVLVDVPELFDRDGIYGTPAGDYPDNALRFAVFSRAALEYPRLRAMRPSVIHAHDWQAGLVSVYQKMHLSNDPFVGGVPAVFTIHNLAFQGVFPAATLPAIGLGFEVLDVQGLEFWGNISYLKGGINFSEKITTVSPGYAAGNRPARARLRLRRRARPASGRPRGDPQRHRHGALDAGGRRVRSRLVQRRRPAREARRQARGPAPRRDCRSTTRRSRGR